MSRKWKKYLNTLGEEIWKRRSKRGTKIVRLNKNKKLKPRQKSDTDRLKKKCWPRKCQKKEKKGEKWKWKSENAEDSSLPNQNHSENHLESQEE